MNKPINYIFILFVFMWLIISSHDLLSVANKRINKNNYPDIDLFLINILKNSKENDLFFFDDEVFYASFLQKNFDREVLLLPKTFSNRLKDHDLKFPDISRFNL